MTTPDSDQRQSRRLQLVDEHVRLENRHDLDGIITTFGSAAYLFGVIVFGVHCHHSSFDSARNSAQIKLELAVA
jgi:hypothetical protein